MVKSSKKKSSRSKKHKDAGNDEQGEPTNRLAENDPRDSDIQNDKDDNDEDDDAEMLAAAAAWAEQDVVDPSKKALEEDSSTKDSPSKHGGIEAIESSNEPQTWSLHVTQLSFDATEMDIRHHFVSKGCVVTSVRLVYDFDRSSNHKTFRGVAFCDVADKASYETALKDLHQSRLMGRRINVRPTRTRKELGSIVERTRELVAEKKRKLQELADAGASDNEDKAKSTKKKKKKQKKKQKEEKKSSKKRQRKEGGKDSAKEAKEESDDDDNNVSPSPEKNAKKKAPASNNDSPLPEKKAEKKASGSNGDTPSPKKKAKKKTSGSGEKKPEKKDHKLTKKERNRKAAIIMQMKRRR